jgi:hypothetical protein
MNSPTTKIMGYNVIENMKKIKAEISMYEIYTLPQHIDLILNTFKSLPIPQHKTTSTLESQHKPTKK